MASASQVITSLLHDGTDMLGTKSLSVKIADESIVSGSLLTVESNHFCVLKSRGIIPTTVYRAPRNVIAWPMVEGFPWKYRCQNS